MADHYSLQEDEKSSLDQFKVMVASEQMDEAIIKAEFVRRLEVCFKHDNKKAENFAEIFALIDRASSRDEFVFYTENFLKLLSKEMRQAKTDNQQRFDRLAIIFDGYFDKHLKNANLKTLDKQSNQDMIQALGIGASSVASPVAGLAGHIVGPLINVADKVNTLHNAAVKLGVTENSKKTVWQRLTERASKAWQTVKGGIKKAWDWCKKNPAKAIAGVLVAAAVIVLPFIFLPILAAGAVVAAVAGAARLIHHGYVKHQAAQQAMQRVDQFNRVMDRIQGFSAEEHAANDHHLSSTAIIDKREGVKPGMTLVDDHELQQQIYAARGSHLLTPEVQQRVKEELPKPAVSKEDEESPPGESDSDRKPHP